MYSQAHGLDLILPYSTSKKHHNIYSKTHTPQPSPPLDIVIYYIISFIVCYTLYTSAQLWVCSLGALLWSTVRELDQLVLLSLGTRGKSVLVQLDVTLELASGYLCTLSS